MLEMLKQLLNTRKAPTHAWVKPRAVMNNDSKICMPMEREDSASLVPISPIIGILGAKGGSGATTIAINLSFALSCQYGLSTLVDAHLQEPDIAVVLGQEPRFTILDLLLRAGDYPREVYEACCVEIHKHLKLLTPPLLGEAAVHGNLSQLASCLDVIGSYSGRWVVDLPRHLDRHFVNLIDRCHVIVLVFEATLTGVSSARRWLKTLGELGYNQDKIVCVVNRSGSHVMSIEGEVGACFAGYQVFKVPNAFKLSEVCTTYGQPAVIRCPNEPYAKSIKRLATLLSEYLVAQVGDQRVLTS